MMMKIRPSKKLKGLTLALFSRVYTGVSAIMYVDRFDRPVCFQQFDSYAGFPRKLDEIPEGCRVALVSNHPEGGAYVTDEDERNLVAAHLLLQVPVHLYLLVGNKFNYAGTCVVADRSTANTPLLTAPNPIGPLN